MTRRITRDEVVAALRVEDVMGHLGITGRFHGAWLRSARCAETDHGSDAFALKRDGHWHCYSCDKGGDILALLAAGMGVDVRANFSRVLELAAELAGIDMDPGANIFGDGPVKPPPRPRPELPQLPPIETRIATARKRAAWVWDRLYDQPQLIGPYLRSRGLDPEAVFAREALRCCPVRMDRPGDDANQDLRTLWWTFGPRRGTLSVVFPVRAATDGALIDLRARRLDPEPGQPKIIGMVGGITSTPAERGKTRQLLGCYGSPHSIESDHVVVCEGAMDYASALTVWPNAQVLAAVEAGSLGIVTRHAARTLASRGPGGRLTIVEQHDPLRLNKATGKMIAGAADAAVNEDPNAATKVAVAHLGPRRVGWLFCSYAGDDGVIGSPRADLGGQPVKDLNDLVRVGADIAGMLTWWTDLASDE